MNKSRKYEVKRKITGIQKTFRKWSDWEVDDQIIGKYQGTHTDNYDKECVMIEIEEAFFKDKKAAQAVIGKTIVLNACGSTNKMIEGEPKLGTLFSFTYQGMDKMTSGKYAGKDAHIVDICELSSTEDVADDVEDQDDDL